MLSAKQKHKIENKSEFFQTQCLHRNCICNLKTVKGELFSKVRLEAQAL